MLLDPRIGENMEQYNKLIYAFISALVVALGAIYVALTDNIISAQEWISIISTFLVPMAVYFAPKNNEIK